MKKRIDNKTDYYGEIFKLVKIQNANALENYSKKWIEIGFANYALTYTPIFY